MSQSRSQSEYTQTLLNVVYKDFSVVVLFSKQDRHVPNRSAKVYRRIITVQSSILTLNDLPGAENVFFRMLRPIGSGCKKNLKANPV